MWTSERRLRGTIPGVDAGSARLSHLGRLIAGILDGHRRLAPTPRLLTQVRLVSEPLVARLSALDPEGLGVRVVDNGLVQAVEQPSRSSNARRTNAQRGVTLAGHDLRDARSDTEP